MARDHDHAERARPELPQPSCKVMLVCGPPASGKSTYVNAHAGPDDLVIDLDLIAREHGYGRDRPMDGISVLLQDRNARLVSLATQPAERVAWVILSAPSRALRQWWCDALGVAPGDLIVLAPPPAELRRRILADPDRKAVRALHLGLVTKWFIREHANDPGILKGGCDENGFPIDQLHPWNRPRRHTIPS